MQNHYNEWYRAKTKRSLFNSTLEGMGWLHWFKICTNNKLNKTYNIMKVAILISGAPRTFVLEEQIIFYTNFLKNIKETAEYDVFLMLKINDTDRIQSLQGLENLQKMIQVLNPKYSIAFEQWTINNDVYYSQINMINHLMHKALEYETENNRYDYFIRIRPDLLLLDTIDLNKIENYVYTSYKFDSPGNDQFFIINRKVLILWWFKMIEPTLSQLDIYKGAPDIIFNKCKLLVKQCLRSGIVRDYKKIDSWNHGHCKLNPPNYWLTPQTFEIMNRELFIENIQNIIPYQQIVQ